MCIFFFSQHTLYTYENTGRSQSVSLPVVSTPTWAPLVCSPNGDVFLRRTKKKYARKTHEMPLVNIIDRRVGEFRRPYAISGFAEGKRIIYFADNSAKTSLVVHARDIPPECDYSEITGDRPAYKSKRRSKLPRKTPLNARHYRLAILSVLRHFVRLVHDK